VTDIGGGLLVVSQFTLYGDTRKVRARASPMRCHPPRPSGLQRLHGKVARDHSVEVAEGKFAAMMDVDLVNDGPVTIVLDSHA